MNETETEQAADERDIIEQAEDDDPDSQAGDEVVYDLGVPAGASGGA
jgi:hypothetical protein